MSVVWQIDLYSLAQRVSSVQLIVAARYVFVSVFGCVFFSLIPSHSTQSCQWQQIKLAMKYESHYVHQWIFRFELLHFKLRSHSLTT